MIFRWKENTVLFFIFIIGNWLSLQATCVSYNDPFPHHWPGRIMSSWGTADWIIITVAYCHPSFTLVLLFSIAVFTQACYTPFMHHFLLLWSLSLPCSSHPHWQLLPTTAVKGVGNVRRGWCDPRWPSTAPRSAPLSWLHRLKKMCSRSNSSQSGWEEQLCVCVLSLGSPAWHGVSHLLSHKL